MRILEGGLWVHIPSRDKYDVNSAQRIILLIIYCKCHNVSLTCSSSSCFFEGIWKLMWYGSKTF